MCLTTNMAILSYYFNVKLPTAIMWGDNFGSFDKNQHPDNWNSLHVQEHKQAHFKITGSRLRVFTIETSTKCSH